MYIKGMLTNAILFSAILIGGVVIISYVKNRIVEKNIEKKRKSINKK